MSYSAKIHLPPTISQLLLNAGYEGSLNIVRSDNRQITVDDLAHLSGMMRAVETDLEDAKARDA